MWGKVSQEEERQQQCRRWEFWFNKQILMKRFIGWERPVKLLIVRPRANRKSEGERHRGTDEERETERERWNWLDVLCNVFQKRINKKIADPFSLSCFTKRNKKIKIHLLSCWVTQKNGWEWHCSKTIPGLILMEPSFLIMPVYWVWCSSRLYCGALVTLGLYPKHALPLN